MTMFKIDDREIKRLESDLKTLAARALPFATKNTLNKTVFTGQKIAREGIKREFTTRNRFTVQSVRVEQARTLRISNQSATLGSTADYMEDQEFGGTKTKTGKHGVAIATSFSAGQGEDAQPRTRLPRRANSLASLRLSGRRKKGRTKGQQNKVAVIEAAKSGHKFVFLELERRKGIFKVTGGKRRPKVKMLHDLTRPSVRIKRNPWLGPAVDQIQKLVPGIYKESLEFQLKRLGLLGR